ncbi:MAG: eL32 family ribosomal protein [Nanoarchaeota archaeon]
MTFLRRTWYRFSRLGKGRRKKQKWRNPTGRHNKIRKRRKGYSARVSIGYSKDKTTKGRIDKKIPRIIHNLKELEKIGKNEIAIMGKIGGKKRIEIIKKAKEMKIQIKDMNIEKFIKKTDRRKK